MCLDAATCLGPSRFAKAIKAGTESAMALVNVYVTFNGVADVAWDDLGNKATVWLTTQEERVPITMTAEKLDQLYHVLQHALAVTRPRREPVVTEGPELQSANLPVR